MPSSQLTYLAIEDKTFFLQNRDGIHTNHGLHEKESVMLYLITSV